jgi:hypothetical protein
VDGLLNKVAEGDEVGVGGAAAVDQGEGVARGDAGLAEAVSLVEAGAFEQPGGGQLGEAVRCGPVGDGGGFQVERGRDGGECFDGDDGVLEEGAGAAAVGVSFDQEHAFAAADLADGVVDVERRGGGCARGEVLLQVGVAEVGRGGGVETEGDAGDDVAAAVGGVETAAAVAEGAVSGGEGYEGGSFGGVEVEGADVGDGVGDLLAVGADVLDGGSADQSGDTGEALDAGDSLLADGEDEGVPVVAGGDGVLDGVGGGGGDGGGAGEGDVEDDAVEAGVGDEEIAAAAEDECGQVVLVGEFDGFDESGFSGDFAEVTGGPADAEGGVRGQRDGLLNTDRGTLHGSETTTWGLDGTTGIRTGEVAWRS